MSKILVTYFSPTGNTKKVAEVIFETLEGDKSLETLDSIKSLDDYSLIILGFPVHSHSVPVKVQNFIKEIPANKKIAFFSTHGSLTGSKLSREALEHAVVLASKLKVLGTFSCRGKVSTKALEVLRRSPEHTAWTDMAASARSHPDESDLEDARTFTRWITTLSVQQ